MDELQFEFAPPNTADAGESALETEEKRRINLITIIVKLMTLLRRDENMLVMHLNAYSRKLLNKLSGLIPNDVASAGLIFDKLPTSLIFNREGKFEIQVYGCELL